MAGGRGAVSTLATVVLVHDYVAPVAVASFGITLVLLAHLVIRRGLDGLPCC